MDDEEAVDPAKPSYKVDEKMRDRGREAVDDFRRALESGDAEQDEAPVVKSLDVAPPNDERARARDAVRRLREMGL